MYIVIVNTSSYHILVAFITSEIKNTEVIYWCCAMSLLVSLYFRHLSWILCKEKKVTFSGYKCHLYFLYCACLMFLVRIYKWMLLLYVYILLYIREIVWKEYWSVGEQLPPINAHINILYRMIISFNIFLTKDHAACWRSGSTPSSGKLIYFDASTT